MSQRISSIRKTTVSSAVAAALLFTLALPAQAVRPAPNDWLWLSANATGCTFTVTVNWAGFKDAKALEVFVTETYTGAPLVPTVVPIKNKDNTATVVLPPLASSATASLFYPWAQLLDSQGNAIPASLDFSGQSLLYCAAP